MSISSCTSVALSGGDVKRVATNRAIKGVSGTASPQPRAAGAKPRDAFPCLAATAYREPPTASARRSATHA